MAESNFETHMHILLLNEYYPPDTSATAKMAAQVAETLAQRHHVTVVAGRPSYDPDARYPYALLRREKRNKVMIECVGSTAYSRHKMPRRVANYLSYLALAVPRALALRPDVILAMTDPPVAGIAGAFIARLSGCPFVYNIRDLYPDMAVGGDIVRASKWVARWENLHRRALKQAARVIVLGDDMRERILAKGVAPERVVVVRDGTTPARAPAQMPRRDDPVVQELRQGFPFVALHAGNLGLLRRVGHAARSRENFEQRKHWLRVHRRRRQSRGAGIRRAPRAERKIRAVSTGRTTRARHDGRRRAHHHNQTRPGGRRRAQQAVLNSRSGTSNPGSRAAGIGRSPHRRRIRLRRSGRSRRSRRRRRGDTRTARAAGAFGRNGRAGSRNRRQIC